ncbi:MAG: hypothetical protein KAU99_03885 [Thermoplasmata archaeon]|nr:hypothetical protein [Thermoplasmata archaeon]MCK4455470.1 hypothetical protein [Thermoplasmata archaeon]
MRAEVAVLLAAAGVLLVIGALGYMITETEIVAGDPPDTPTVEMIQPYLPAGMTSLALGLIILVVAVVAAVAMRSR